MRLRYDLPMILGADTLVRVTEDIVGMVRQRFGSTPLFWGRYFKRPGFAEDYHPASENAVFNANAIRLLPIARQTNRVAGTAPDGAADAILNVDAFTTALDIDYLRKIGGELLMFLDVEGTSERHPNLSLEYWMGWSTALTAHARRSGIAMLPAVYCRQNQNATWDAIARADQLGFPCAGAWVFRMRTGACTKPIPGWDVPFNTPSVALPCPVMLWQFAIDCIFDGGVDFNMVNPDPAVASALLNRLVFPGAG
ncbi:MAG TPA: hypothetical protein VNI54_18210 [Thermoanaerobaculia bacterium]|nr:hypothetical protein [Thermoanaerobaculia bacterium]